MWTSCSSIKDFKSYSFQNYTNQKEPDENKGNIAHGKKCDVIGESSKGIQLIVSSATKFHLTFLRNQIITKYKLKMNSKAVFLVLSSMIAIATCACTVKSTSYSTDGKQYKILEFLCKFNRN